MKRMNPISPDEKTKDGEKGKENTTQKKGEREIKERKTDMLKNEEP